MTTADYGRRLCNHLTFLDDVPADKRLVEVSSCFIVESSRFRLLICPIYVRSVTAKCGTDPHENRHYKGLYLQGF